MSLSCRNSLASLIWSIFSNRLWSSAAGECTSLKGLQPKGSVPCCDSHQRPWLWGCENTMGSAACWLARPFMPPRDVVSTGMAVWFTSLTLTLGSNHNMGFSCCLCTCVSEGETPNAQAREAQDKRIVWWHVHSTVCHVFLCLCLCWQNCLSWSFNHVLCPLF